MLNKKTLWVLGALNILVLALIIFPITRSKNADAQALCVPTGPIACTGDISVIPNCDNGGGISIACSGGFVTSITGTFYNGDCTSGGS